MKKQRRGINRYNMLQDGKKKKRILYICMIHKKLTLKKKTKKQKKTKYILPGFEPTLMKIDDS